MVAAIIGLGLIGGSMALAMKDKGIVSEVIGVDADPLHEEKALSLGLVHRIDTLTSAVKAADLVVIAVPVNTAIDLIIPILNIIDKQVVMDVGSTKQGIIDAVKGHPKRKQFVATHPMWGTEYSGPEAAVKNAFTDKATVVCNKKESLPEAEQLVEEVYRKLGMHIIYMDAAAHDIHVAYVSHISHITSFALANTVLEKEREEDAIFELASGGFESTVRLAKSNPSMWVPIFMQNRENVLDVLNEHISQLKKFKACLEKENVDYLKDLIEHANSIKRIIR
jgi:prephenate dehydrogenase